MVLNVPEIPPKVTRTLLLFKDVTIRLGLSGVKCKSDDVTLYEVVFLLRPFAFSTRIYLYWLVVYVCGWPFSISGITMLSFGRELQIQLN